MDKINTISSIKIYLSKENNKNKTKLDSPKLYILIINEMKIMMKQDRRDMRENHLRRKDNFFQGLYFELQENSKYVSNIENDFYP